MGHHGKLPKNVFLTVVALGVVFGLVLLGLSAGWPGSGVSISICSSIPGSTGSNFCAAGAFGIITGVFSVLVGAGILFFAFTDRDLHKHWAYLSFAIVIFSVIALGIWAWGVNLAGGDPGEAADLTRADLAFSVLCFITWTIIGIDLLFGSDSSSFEHV